jgi:BMFP domain-containing protein YqiC
MHSSLIKKVKEDREEYIKSFNNSSFVFTPIIALLQELVNSADVVKKEDFDCPNHYAKLAFQAGEKKAYQFILEVLESSDKK